MFAYCLNNPVVLQDGNGQSAIVTVGCLAIGGIIGGIANFAAVLSNGGSAKDCALGALAGFIGGVAGVGVAAFMATTPYAEITGRVTATLVTDVCTSLFINGKLTKEDVAYMAVDVTMDVVLSTIFYGNNSILADEKPLKRSLVNTVADGFTDFGQNELFNPSSAANRNAAKRNTLTHRERAHQKVGALIGAM